MSDPTIKRSTVTINYAASDGYKCSVNYSNRGRCGISPPGALPLLEGIEELARLCELFGLGDKAAERCAGATARVREWRAARTGSKPE